MVLEFGVPQGSVQGPLYFLLYSVDALQLAENHGFNIHGYADDLQLYDHCSTCDMDSLVQRMGTCIEAIRDWMSRNRLRLNSSKTEIIWLGSEKRLAKCSIRPLIISGNIVQPASAVRNLGIIFDSAMSFSVTTPHSWQADATTTFVRFAASDDHLRSTRVMRWFAPSSSHGWTIVTVC